MIDRVVNNEEEGLVLQEDIDGMGRSVADGI